MSKTEEVPEDPKPNDGGGSAPVAGSEDQKKENGPRLAEWENTISRAFIAYSLNYFAGDVETARQIKRIVDELDRLCGREKVDKLWLESPFSTAAKRQAFEERVSAAVAV